MIEPAAAARACVAAIVSTMATDALLATYPVTFPNHRDRKATYGKHLAWDVDANVPSLFVKDNIAKSLAVSIAILGVTSIPTCVLSVDAVIKYVLRFTRTELLSAKTMAAVVPAMRVSTAWFLAMAAWLTAYGKGILKSSFITPTRRWARACARAGWVVSAIVFVFRSIESA